METTIKACRHSTRVGELCTHGAHGVIHSVFRRVINILVQNELYSISAIENGDFPNAIIVKPSQISSFLDLGLETTLVARFTKHCVVIGNQLQIDIENSTMYSDKKEISVDILDVFDIQKNLEVAIAEGKLQSINEGLGFFWEFIKEILSGDPLDITDLTAFQKKALHLITNLIHGLRGRNLELIKSTACELSGLGIGLTPSGDDLLTGLIAAFRMLGSRTMISNYYSQIVDLILMSSTGKTNAVAYQMLLSATRQEIMSGLANYISALVSTEPFPIKTTTRQLFSYGHSSGSELGLGALIGITLVNEARTNLHV